MPGKPLLAVVASLLLVGAACAGDARAPGDTTGATLDVVASLYPLYEAARQVGGDRVSVVDLTPPGTEPHDLELSPRDLDLVIEADVVLYLGRGFQPAVSRAVERAEGITVDLLEGLELVTGEAHGHGHGDDGHGHDEASEGEEVLDPHVWLDPRRYEQMIERIADTLARADPEGAQEYQERADAFRAEIRDLDVAYATALSACERRAIVTNHASFGYLAQRYDLEQIAITGISPTGEPDARRIAELTDLVRREGITAIFTETLVSPRVSETLARESGVGTAVLDPIEGLTPQQREAGEDYLSVMRSNLQTLVHVLDCR